MFPSGKKIMLNDVGNGKNGEGEVGQYRRKRGRKK